MQLNDESEKKDFPQENVQLVLMASEEIGKTEKNSKFLIFFAGLGLYSQHFIFFLTYEFA
jgi:hypothetical protein